LEHAKKHFLSLHQPCPSVLGHLSIIFVSRPTFTATAGASSVLLYVIVKQALISHVLAGETANSDPPSMRCWLGLESFVPRT
jgi:hypothetical protein